MQIRLIDIRVNSDILGKNMSMSMSMKSEMRRHYKNRELYYLSHNGCPRDIYPFLCDDRCSGSCEKCWEREIKIRGD